MRSKVGVESITKPKRELMEVGREGSWGREKDLQGEKVCQRGSRRKRCSGFEYQNRVRDVKGRYDEVSR